MSTRQAMLKCERTCQSDMSKMRTDAATKRPGPTPQDCCQAQPPAPAGCLSECLTPMLCNAIPKHRPKAMPCEPETSSYASAEIRAHASRRKLCGPNRCELRPNPLQPKAMSSQAEAMRHRTGPGHMHRNKIRRDDGRCRVPYAPLTLGWRVCQETGLGQTAPRAISFP